MVLVLILGVALAGFALIVIGRALLIPRMRAVHNVAGIEQYGFSATTRVDDPESRSVVNDLASFVGGAVSRRFGGSHEEQLRGYLVAAGMYETSARMLFGYQLLAAVGVPAAWLWVTATNSGLSTAIVVIGTGLTAVLGWLTPVSLVRRRGQARLSDIDYALPELIDLIVVSLEAGIGFAGALNVAADRISGPLGEELRLANQEQRMGLTVTDSLENLQKRAPTEIVRSFTRSIVQGERLGVSMGQIMRNLAIEMRLRRRQMAEERAHKAPVKMLFPLVFMIFPAMFVVLLGPAMYTILDQLKNK